MTQIELNDEDALAFRNFQEHRTAIDVMLAAGVFDMRRGSVEIHFDLEGKIGAIIGHPTMYKRDQLVVIHTSA